MAITAKFEADFSAFNDAVQQAVSGLGALGTALPAAAVVHELTAIAQAAIDSASAIAKMSEQMSISTGEVQSLDYIAGQTGVSLAALTSATQNVTVAVGTHGKGLVQAVNALGLEWDRFAAADPYSRMIILAQGISAIEDPTRRATVAAEAFGKNWKEILPALMADMEALGEAAPKMSDQTVQSLNDIDAAIKRAQATGKVWAGETIAFLEEFARRVKQMPSMTGPISAYQQYLKDQAADAAKTAAAIPPTSYRPAGELGAPSAVPTPLSTRPEIVQSATELKIVEHELNKEIAESIRLNKEAAAAQKKHAEAIKDAAQAMEKEQNRALTIMEGKVYEITRAWGQYATAVAAASHDTTQKQIDDVQRNADAQMAAMDRAKTGSVSAYQAIQMAADQLAANIKQNTLEEDATTLAHYQLVADKAQAAYAFALANSSQYTDERIKQLQTEAEAATTALQNWSRNAVTEVEKIKKPAEEAAKAIKGMHDQILELKGVGTKLPGSQEETDSMGNRYLISPTGQRVPMGPHGEMPGNWWEMYTGQGSTPEAFNPLLLQGRRNVGTLAGAAAVQMNAGAVTINYPVMNDPAAMDKLAGVVGDAIMSRITRTGKVV
jgi:hypothetical protein